MAKPVGPVTFADIEILARTLWGEARSEGFAGLQAVACVILNRWEDRRWPEGIAEVCQQPAQFSVWNSDDPNRSKLTAVTLADVDFRACYAVAGMAVAGLLKDDTGGANHYFNPAIVRRPSWADPNRRTVAIGRHEFYRL